MTGQNTKLNRLIGANAGGPREFAIRMPLAARVAQFRRPLVWRLEGHALPD